MACATLAAKFCGLVRDSLIAAFFSIGNEADAFMAASKLPTTLFDMVIGGVISASFIPVFNNIRVRSGDGDARKFANKFLTLIILIAAAISILGIVFSDRLVALVAPEFTGAKHELTAQLTSIMFPMIIFTGIAFSCVGLLQSFGEYNVPALISLVSNLAIILYFAVLGKRFGVVGLSVTMVAAWSLQVLVQVPALRKFSFHYRPDFRFRDPDIKRVIKLAGPMLVATWVQPLYSIINGRLASGIDGAVSGLEYANRLYIIVTGVFSFVVTNLIFPKLAKANAEGDDEQARTLTVTSVKAIFLIILPVMLMFIILARPVTSIIYERSSFDSQAAELVASALSFYSIGMLGLAMNEVLSKVFFSIGDSKTPMRNSILSMIVNIALAYILFTLLKTRGLALAAACGSIFNALMNMLCLRKRFPHMLKKHDILSLAKGLAAAAGCAAAVLAVYYPLRGVLGSGFINNIILCAASGGCGAAVYAALLVLMKNDMMCGLLYSIFKRKENL